MLRSVLALALAACGGATAGKEQPLAGRPRADATPTATIRGWDALVIGDRAFVVTAGFDAIEAYQPATGRRLWRTALPEPTTGRHALLAIGGGVALWAANRMFLFDPATGRLVRTPDDVPRSDRCWLDTTRGACGFRCDCDFRVVDCATARVTGPTYTKTYVDFHETDESGHAGDGGGCYGGGGDLIGRAGPVTILSIEDTGHPRAGGLGGPLAFVGVEVRSGRELYRIPASPLSSTVAPSATGITADGATCYAGDHEGQLVVWDCASGRIWWTAPAVPTSGSLPGHLVQPVDGHGLFRRAGATAAVHDEHTGAVRWTVATPADQLALLTGAPAPASISLSTPSDSRTTTLAWITQDASVTAPVPADASIRDSDDGGVLVLSAHALVAYDRRGAVLARTDAALPANLTIAGDHLDLFDGVDFALLDRALRPRLHLTGTVASAPGSTLGSLALYRWPPPGSASPGEILLYALPAAP